MGTKRVKKMMIDRDLSVQEIANRTGFSKQYMSNVINGRYTGQKARAAIADVLGETPEKLWGKPTRRKRTAPRAATSCPAG